MEKTIAFFERKGLTKLKEAYNGAVWDTWRVSGFAEILGFYGLCYWYVYQVSVLGIGPIWMSSNKGAQARAKRLLEDGNIFAFGLSFNPMVKMKVTTQGEEVINLL